MTTAQLVQLHSARRDVAHSKNGVNYNIPPETCVNDLAVHGGAGVTSLRGIIAPSSIML